MKSVLLLKLATLTDDQIKNLPYYGDVESMQKLKVSDFWHLLKNVSDDIKREIKDLTIYDLWTYIDPLKTKEQIKEELNFYYDEGNEDLNLNDFINVLNSLSFKIDNRYISGNEKWLSMPLLSFENLQNVLTMKEIEGKDKEEHGYNEASIQFLESLTQGQNEGFTNFNFSNKTIKDLLVELSDRYNFFDENLFISFMNEIAALYNEKEKIWSEEISLDRESDDLSFQKKKRFYDKYFEVLFKYINSFIAAAEIRQKLTKENVDKKTEKVLQIRESDIFDPFLKPLDTKILQFLPKKEKQEPKQTSPAQTPSVRSLPANELTGEETTIIGKSKPAISEIIERDPKESIREEVTRANTIYDYFLKSALILQDI